MTPDESPLAHARLHRQLTVDEAARRASVSPDEVQWLEEGRLYRFPTPDRALTVALLYATALGIDHREALELAGLPTPPLPTSPPTADHRPRGVRGGRRRRGPRRRARPGRLEAEGVGPAASASALPAPWAVKVVVLNGSGDIVYTRSIASRVQALSYRVTHVGRATSFNYLQTVVYYPPGGEPVCTRLAQQLEVPVQPLPGRHRLPRRCVVIVGPERGAGERSKAPGATSVRLMRASPAAANAAAFRGLARVGVRASGCLRLRQPTQFSGMRSAASFSFSSLGIGSLTACRT